MKTRSVRFFPMFFLASVLLILFSTSLSTAALPESQTNTSKYDVTMAEYIESEEKVYFGESGIEQRFLAGYSSPNKYISYRGLERPPICNANIYGNCIKPIGNEYRPCTVYTRCKRGLK